MPIIIARPGLAGGRPFVDGHRVGVATLAMAYEKRNLNAATLAREFNLRAPHVQAALDYFADHREVIQGIWRDDAAQVKELAARAPRARYHGLGEVGLRLYLDASAPRSLAERLTAARPSLDIETAAHAEMLNATDDQHLAFTTSIRRVLVTMDTACLHWHATGMWHRGIIYMAPDMDLDESAAGLLDMQASLSAEDMVGQLLFILPGG